MSGMNCKLERLVGLSGPFSVIYADPPWGSGNGGPPQTSPDAAYQTMRVTDIAALPVAKISAWDSCCFMWATWPLIEEAMFVLRSWGFKYTSVAFVWVKQTTVAHKVFMGMGAWTRSNTEFVLLGTHGNPQRVSKAVSQVVLEPVREHSRKPDSVRDKIVELCGDVPRIELFARPDLPMWPHPAGWTVWGNEVEANASGQPRLAGNKKEV